MHVTNSASNLMAIIFGLAVFALIVAIGWRSVQNRRILRLQGANGQETIIVAREDDDISSVVTTTETTPAAPAPASAPSVLVVNTGVAEPAPAPEFGRSSRKSKSKVDLEASVVGPDRVSRAVSSTK
jgi:hypothetical protein